MGEISFPWHGTVSQRPSLVFLGPSEPWAALMRQLGLGPAPTQALCVPDLLTGVDVMVPWD